MLYLLGGSGVPNYGDELIAKLWLEHIERSQPDRRVFIECTNPSVSAVRMQHRNWRASHVSIVRQVLGDQPMDSFWKSFERGYKFFHRGGFSKTKRLFGMEEIFEGSEIFHMVGGGYISTNWPRTGFLLGFAGSLKGTFGTRVMATGVGLMPMEPPPVEYRRMFRRAIEGFEFIETRDTASARFLRKMSGRDDIAHAGLDDTFLEPIRGAGGGHPRTLHLSSFLVGDELSELVGRLRALKPEIERTFERVLFWNCAPARDRPSAAAVKEVFPESIEADVWSLVDDLPVRPGDFMITTRFHPHLLAARAGAQGYYLEGDGPYYRTKHRSVVGLGSPFRNYTTLDEFGFGSPAPATIVDLDADRVAQKQAAADRIYSAAMPKAARANLDLMPA